MGWLDRIPVSFLLVAVLLIGPAPFVPEPHVVEKVRMLLLGTLRNPLDIFDLFFHLFPLILLVLKQIRKTAANRSADQLRN